ncbi:heparinase II/III domain-containing protein [Aestuariimicrobium kwangyangense]|uniref:heparinase II/III domain-containing protein n=1 Tax=Aestuariimicrobium kwangyangense TaxID=396389 RepID=UPI0003B3743B|nr:heparinase II/III family protein [Aestuariimicrobium kwangyangense]
MTWTFTADDLVAALPDEVTLVWEPVRDEPRLDDFWRTLAAATDEALAAPEPTLPRTAVWEYLDTGARLPYEDAYFARRRRLAAIGLSSMAGRRDALHALPDRIAAVCEEPSWALPAHGGWEPGGQRQVDLFAAETANTLAELVTLLSGELDPRVHDLVTEQVSRRVLDPLADPDTSFWWETAENNWSAVCAGAVGSAALLLEHDRERLVRILARVLSALDWYLSGFGSDGGCAEGLGYWSYGMVHFIGFADLVERLTSGAVRLADDPRALAAAEFPAKVSLPGGAGITFSDTTDDPVASSAVGWWHGRGIELPTVPVEVIGQDPCARWLSISRAPVWLPPETPGRPHVDLLDDTGWLVVSNDDRALAVKAGDNGESHNQLDLGQLSVWVGSEQVLLDPGSGVYTREYFADETRYDFFEPSSFAHNAPLVDGRQQRLGAEARAVVTGHELGLERGWISLDLSSALPDGLRNQGRVERRVEWADAGASVTLTDTVVADGSTVGWHLVSEVEPEVLAGGLRWQASRGTLTAALSTGRVEVCRLDTRSHHGAPRTLWIAQVTAELDGSLVWTCQLSVDAGGR